MKGKETVSFNYIVTRLRKLGIAEHRRRILIRQLINPIYDINRKKTVYSKNEVDKVIDKLQYISKNFKNISEISKDYGWSRCKVRNIVKKHKISSVSYPFVVRPSYNLQELKIFLFPKKNAGGGSRNIMDENLLI